MPRRLKRPVCILCDVAKPKVLAKRKAYATSCLFAIWYLLSFGYNIYFKQALNLAPAGTTGSIQMAGGILYVFVLPLCLGGVRSVPSVCRKDVNGSCQLLFFIHWFALALRQHGSPCSFLTNIDKASEPSVSAALTALGGWTSRNCWGGTCAGFRIDISHGRVSTTPRSRILEY